MLDHQLEICHETVGNELTTTVQLIAFLKKQLSNSKHHEVHEWVINSPCYHNKELASPEQTATAEVVPKSVAGSSFSAASSTLLPFDVQKYGVGFKMLLFNPLEFSKKDLSRNLKYVVPTGRVKVPAGRYVVPTGKDNVIVSAGRSKVIPAGRVYVSGHVDIFDMVDIDMFTVIALNMMVVNLGYIGESKPLFYNYLRPLTSLDEGLYALACEEDVRCLATLVKSFKLIKVYIEHGVTALDSYIRPPRFRAAI
ncbi:hypothetical protein Tco_0829864 [Tanacetum coccineum]